jgi:hypothetical protein
MISTSVPSFAHPVNQVRLGVIGRGLPGEGLSESSSGRPESSDQCRIGDDSIERTGELTDIAVWHEESSPSIQH